MKIVLITTVESIVRKSPKQFSSCHYVQYLTFVRPRCGEFFEKLVCVEKLKTHDHLAQGVDYENPDFPANFVKR